MALAGVSKKAADVGVFGVARTKLRPLLARLGASKEVRGYDRSRRRCAPGDLCRLSRCRVWREMVVETTLWVLWRVGWWHDAFDVLSSGSACLPGIMVEPTFGVTSVCVGCRRGLFVWSPASPRSFGSFRSGCAVGTMFLARASRHRCGARLCGRAF